MSNLDRQATSSTKGLQLVCKKEKVVLTRLRLELQRVETEFRRSQDKLDRLAQNQQRLWESGRLEFAASGQVSASSLCRSVKFAQSCQQQALKVGSTISAEASQQRRLVASRAKYIQGFAVSSRRIEMVEERLCDERRRECARLRAKEESEVNDNISIHYALDLDNNRGTAAKN